MAKEKGLLDLPETWKAPFGKGWDRGPFFFVVHAVNEAKRKCVPIFRKIFGGARQGTPKVFSMICGPLPENKKRPWQLLAKGAGIPMKGSFL